MQLGLRVGKAAVLYGATQALRSVNKVIQFRPPVKIMTDACNAQSQLIC